MSHLSRLSTLPDWEVTYEIGGKTKTKIYKAPTAKRAVEYAEFVARQKSNQRITITNVVRWVRKV